MERVFTSKELDKVRSYEAEVQKVLVEALGLVPKEVDPTLEKLEELDKVVDELEEVGRGVGTILRHVSLLTQQYKELREEVCLEVDGHEWDTDEPICLACGALNMREPEDRDDFYEDN